MLKKIIITAVAISLLLIIILAYGFFQATKIPDNNPEAFLGKKPEGQNKITVCIGDSITHGRVSYNYIDILTGRLKDNGFLFVNAGINSELAYNVLQRIDNIIKCDPDFITILIGTNDANASISEKNSKRAIKNMTLPQKPTKDWYSENLTKISKELKNKTGAKIALLSLPPIGEDPTHTAFLRSKEYSRVIKEIAHKENLFYLPLNEKMEKYLNKNKKVQKVRYHDLLRIMYIGIFQHHILGKSYDKISEENGFLIVTDFLHLNSRGANMTADLIEKFLVKNSSDLESK